MRIGCSGQVSERSGIGVLQKHLYGYLSDSGHDLVFSRPRDTGVSPIARGRGLVRGLRPARGPVDVYLSTVPPLPLGVRTPLLTVVHDLRWLRTRSKFGAAYRAWDLRRSVLHSDALLCISEKTRRDLVEFIPQATASAAVQWLGPGQVPEGSFRDSQSGMLMLVGDAPHKRNELAAAALASARPPWVRGIIGVGVSEYVQAILSKDFSCEWFQGISDAEMLALYQRAEFFLMIGTDEGFGLPFVEALAAGCQVIATDHALAREVLGSAGLLIAPGSAAAIGQQLLCKPSVPAPARATHAQRFSWEVYGEACELQLMQLAKACRA